MISEVDGFLDLYAGNETGDDLVDHFHIDTAQEPDGALVHVNDAADERWKRQRRPLGVGGFGTAWLETSSSGRVRVVKEVQKAIPHVSTKYWIRELSAMALLSKNRTCFPHFYGWFQDPTYVYIAMEHFQLGDLAQCVTNTVVENQTQTIVQQLTTALKAMHGKRITHRDLKPANVLVRRGPPAWEVAISDFGISKRVRGMTTALYTSFDGDFMAPEILGFYEDDTQGQYTNAVDLWSLGCIAYWLLTHNLPVPRNRFMFHCSRPWAEAAARIEVSSISEQAKDFILALLRPNPNERMTTSTAIAHTWLKDAKAEALLSPGSTIVDVDALPEAHASLVLSEEPCAPCNDIMIEPRNPRSPEAPFAASEEGLEYHEDSLSQAEQAISAGGATKTAINEHVPQIIKTTLSMEHTALADEVGQGKIDLGNSATTKLQPQADAQTPPQERDIENSIQNTASDYSSSANEHQVEQPSPRMKPLAALHSPIVINQSNQLAQHQSAEIGTLGHVDINAILDPDGLQPRTSIPVHVGKEREFQLSTPGSVEKSSPIADQQPENISAHNRTVINVSEQAQNYDRALWMRLAESVPFEADRSVIADFLRRLSDTPSLLYSLEDQAQWVRLLTFARRAERRGSYNTIIALCTQLLDMIELQKKEMTMFERPALYACRAAAQHILYRDDAAMHDSLKSLQMISTDALTWYIIGRIHYCLDEISVAHSAFNICRASASRDTLAWRLTQSLLEAGQIDSPGSNSLLGEPHCRDIMKQMCHRWGISSQATGDHDEKHIVKQTIEEDSSVKNSRMCETRFRDGHHVTTVASATPKEELRETLVAVRESGTPTMMNEGESTISEPPSVHDKDEDDEDVCYPCKGCGEFLEEGKAFELAGHRWHFDCFRCNTCKTLLDSNGNLLLLGDGNLICNNCTYDCSSCGKKIEDLAILTGDQAFCAPCFRCRNCKRKIENLRYARTSQGIFCMDCHNALMARRRKMSRPKQEQKGNTLERPKSDKNGIAASQKSAATLMAFDGYR